MPAMPMDVPETFLDLNSHIQTSTVYLEDHIVIYCPKRKVHVISHFFVSARYYVLVVLTDGEIEVQLGSASFEAEVTV